MNVTACVLRLSGLGLAAALVAQPTWAAAAAFDVNDPAAFASASAQLNNLRFRLVDLDANDGVLPSITFFNEGSHSAVTVDATGRSVSRFVNSAGSAPYVDEFRPYASSLTAPGSANGASTWLPTSTLATTSLDGVSQASASASSLSASTRLTTADAKGGAGPLYEFDSQDPDRWMSSSVASADAGGQADIFTTLFKTTVDPVSGQTVYVSRQPNGLINPGSLTQEPYFVLSAKTGVVFESTAQGNIRMDLNKFDDSQLLPTNLIAGINVYTEIGALEPTTAEQSWLTKADAEASLGKLSATLALNPFRPFGALTTADIAQSKEISLALNNQTTHTMAGYVYGRAYAYAFVEGVGAVPEPSTYALMGLGLVGLALAKGRRARKG